MIAGVPTVSERMYHTALPKAMHFWHVYLAMPKYTLAPAADIARDRPILHSDSRNALYPQASGETSGPHQRDHLFACKTIHPVPRPLQAGADAWMKLQ